MEFTNPSPQLQTALSFLDAVAEQDLTKAMETLTEDAQYIWVPPGFDAVGSRIKDRAETKAFFEASFGKVVKDFKFTIHDHVEMPGKILLQATSTSEFLAAGKGKYENTYMWLFHLDDSAPGAPKIKVVKEFFDSLYSARMWGLLDAPQAGAPS